MDAHDSGWLDVGDGHRVYWETSGDPDGPPLVALHGGPGSGMSRGTAFAAYRLVRFDQRSCGRSTPSAADPATDLSAVTTDHLVADIERLREHLGIDRWVVWGGSWGATLALTYAQRHPSRVRAMILIAVTMTRRYDVHWLYHETGRFFPAEWRVFRDHAVTAGEDPADLVAAYDRLLNRSGDPAVQRAAADAWCAWEDALVSLDPGWTPNPRYDDPDFRLCFARMCAHVFSHGAWLEEGALLRDAHRLAGIPAELIHGRLDLGGPPDVPWLLAQEWPAASLHLLDGGHGSGDAIAAAHSAAVARFAVPE